jgi:hypothetical protein
MCAARAEVLRKKLAEEAKVREMTGKGADGSGGRGHRKNPGAPAPQGLSGTGRSRDEVGKAFGVSGKSVDAALRSLCLPLYSQPKRPCIQTSAKPLPPSDGSGPGYPAAPPNANEIAPRQRPEVPPRGHRPFPPAPGQYVAGAVSGGRSLMR